MTPKYPHWAELEAQHRALMKAVGAHIQADAYRDTFPDDEKDAAFLRKQETWWRLTARSWLGDELANACAQKAKDEVADTHRTENGRS